MSLPAQPKIPLRQSLYVWVLLAMVGILSLSFVAFRAISEQMKAEKIDPVYDRRDPPDATFGHADLDVRMAQRDP